jgi:hypothetical protein
MNRLFKLCVRAFMAGLLTAIPFTASFARLTGTQPARTAPDTSCVGRTGAEICVDSDGNFIPTTTNDTSLGTSSLRWANGYYTLINSAGPITASAGVGVIVSTAPRTAVAVAALYSAYTIPAGTVFYNSTNSVLCVSSGTVQTSIVVSTGTGACPS